MGMDCEGSIDRCERIALMPPPPTKALPLVPLPPTATISEAALSSRRRSILRLRPVGHAATAVAAGARSGARPPARSEAVSRSQRARTSLGRRRYRTCDH
jgi:hypothetical protein